MTIYEIVTKPFQFQQQKHWLPNGYVEEQVNLMTNSELLMAISDAIEELKNEQAK